MTQFAKTATQDGGHVIWIGLPNSSDKRRWPFVGFENQIYRSVANQLPNVTYFDTWDTFAARDGGYTAYYRNGNQVTLVRADDGVHFNSDGYTILMQQVAEFATSVFRLGPEDVRLLAIAGASGSCASAASSAAGSNSTSGRRPLR